MRCRLIAVCLLVACSVAMADNSEKLKEIQKKISERAAKHHSVQYKMNMSMDMSQAGMSIKSNTDATFKYMKKDDKMLVRQESTSVTEMKGNGMDQKTETKGTSVVDGEYSWSYSESQMGKTATKQKVRKQEQEPFDPSVGWDQFDVTPIADEKVGDKTCWVLEMTPKNPMMKAQMSKSVSYYDQATGLPVKQVAYTADGKVMSTMTVTDIKIDEKIDPKEFVFTPPAGVTVQDLSNSDNGMGG
ncbi:MAG: outer membrane lipoprotein carrier protein LolA [Phycisphaerales bacterium]|nr:outer membrane lipoprotein carrier protein LolA [Phycisphaerales bacterium]MCB9856275.1 outer membrane lipoprotein carrier protein LolA [Phycisphaerales bacterium]MCB9863286.1 outer membrane lipoprotein carrier protein LolA [Phycisphaerales bacterium]